MIAEEDEFISKIEELAHKIINSDKIESAQKMSKLKELHHANKVTFEKLAPQKNIKLSYFIGDAITKLKRG